MIRWLALVILSITLCGCMPVYPRAYQNALGQEIHWRLEDYPLSVYVSNQITGMRRAALLEAVDHWNTVLGFEALRVEDESVEEQFEFRDRHRTVYVHLGDLPDIYTTTGVTQGLTAQAWDGDRFTSDMVYLDVATPMSSVYLVLLHEFGHVLGLRHSPIRRDVMFWAASESRGEIPSQDINFIRRSAGLQ